MELASHSKYRSFMACKPSRACSGERASISLRIPASRNAEERNSELVILFASHWTVRYNMQMPRKAANHAGEKHGDITVIKYLGSSRWLCRCGCGEELEKSSGKLEGSQACRRCLSKRQKHSHG